MANYWVAPKTFVLKLINHCHCQGCERKLKNLLSKIHGVHSTSIDANTEQVTISGTVDPQKVLRVLEKKKQKAELMWEEIPKKPTHNMQITTLPQPEPADQQFFHDQNLVAQVQQLKDHVEGLNQLEVTYSKTVKVTVHGKKDELSHESDTHKNIVMDDDRGHRGRGSGGAATSCGGACVWHGGPSRPCGHMHNLCGPQYENYCSPLPYGCGGPEPPPTWLGNYFLPEPQLGWPAYDYNPSAPPLPAGGYSYPYTFDNEENTNTCRLM